MGWDFLRRSWKALISGIKRIRVSQIKGVGPARRGIEIDAKNEAALCLIGHVLGTHVRETSSEKECQVISRTKVQGKLEAIALIGAQIEQLRWPSSKDCPQGVVYLIIEVGQTELGLFTKGATEGNLLVLNDLGLELPPIFARGSRIPPGG